MPPPSGDGGYWRTGCNGVCVATFVSGEGEGTRHQVMGARAGRQKAKGVDRFYWWQRLLQIQLQASKHTLPTRHPREDGNQGALT
jgi:hypothetical protein